MHRREDHLTDPLWVLGERDFTPADVAAIAAVRIQVLAEILHQRTVPAGQASGEVEHRPQQPLRSLPHLGRLPRNEEFPSLEVLAAEEEPALRFQTVPSRATGLLLIVFDRLRHARVDHESDVRLVDPHPERDGRDDHLHLVANERVLVCVPRLVAHPGMVGTRAVAELAQLCCQLLRLLPRQAVDDP